ncbi:5-hydroxytryptamine receptor 2A-like [Penaeus chinensis]|uniref:5-hydroxytryptamine receptor 2A-like n=1 Tax=Penaeus chinensis TaxID=139456 RepID=UPI001FB63F63|nr:5-hydroxytryptamine receptor 2A-like [Penaeus chinensis]
MQPSDLVNEQPMVLRCKHRRELNVPTKRINCLELPVCFSSNLTLTTLPSPHSPLHTPLTTLPSPHFSTTRVKQRVTTIPPCDSSLALQHRDPLLDAIKYAWVKGVAVSTPGSGNIELMSVTTGLPTPWCWFLVSLAAADLLLLLLCVPLETLQYFLWTPHLSLPVCKLSSYFELLSAVASVLNLTAVSLERYIVIVYPMRSRTFCTLSNCRRAIIGVWIVSLVLSVPAGMTQK